MRVVSSSLVLAAALAALAAPARAFTSAPLLRQWSGRAPGSAALWAKARGCGDGAADSAADAQAAAGAASGRLTRRAAALQAVPLAAVAATVLARAPPARAGTVMVGGAAVDAEEETEDEAYEALDPAPGGPLDAILAKVNVKKLGVAGGAFLLADVISGLVMGRSFLKIVSGNADPGELCHARDVLPPAHATHVWLSVCAETPPPPLLDCSSCPLIMRPHIIAP